MSLRVLGKSGPAVFPIALGGAAMSGLRGQAMDDSESIATIQEAIERGVNVIDTADFYGGGHNELLIAQAIKGRREKVVLSDKFGGLRSPDGGFVGIDGRPAAVKNFLTYTLTRLGVDYIDVYRLARADPQVPVEDTIGTISDLIKAGYVRYVGLSEVEPETIRDPLATWARRAWPPRRSFFLKTASQKRQRYLCELAIVAKIGEMIVKSKFLEFSRGN